MTFAAIRGVLAVVVVLLTLNAAPAVASDLDWEIIRGASADWIGSQLQRHAAMGYRVQAIVADAPETTVLVARTAGFRPQPPSAEYRVLDHKDGASVTMLGAEGFHIRAMGRARIGPAIAIFERDTGARRTHTYRSLQAAPAEDLAPLLDPLAAEGYRIVASVGDDGSEWLILEKVDSAAREVRVVAGTDVDQFEEDINRLATNGFTCDAVWNRPPKGFALFKGGTLMAALSRRRGASQPVAPVRINKGQQPDESGEFVTVVGFRGSFVFVVREGEKDYATHSAIFMPSTSKKKQSWIRDPIEEKLDSFWWNPIETAWAIRSSGEVSSWVGLERRAPLRLPGRK
jgi:hypothetical protein